MAGPQFTAPKSVAPSRPRRHFTLGEANSSLPLVKRIVRDIVSTHKTARELQASLSSTASAKEQQATQKSLDSAVGRLQEFVDELAEVGCELKDPEIGLVDFVGRNDNRDVYLCWKLGEEQIAFWHELDAGVAGRQPIAKLKQPE
jgi:hypothetical protein